MSNKEEWFKNFTNCEPADRKATEVAILKQRLKQNRAPWKSLNPTFIWCQSPQSMMIISRLMNDLYESTPPIRPPRTQYRTPISVDYESRESTGTGPVFLGSALTSILRRPLRSPSNSWTTPGHLVRDQIQSSIYISPSSDLWSQDIGKKSHDIYEAALNTSQPHISEIKLNKEYLGRRLRIVGSSFGQHSGPTDYLQPYCGWMQDFGVFVILCERQAEIHLENQTEVRDIFMGTRAQLEIYRLHNNQGPAISWNDGFRIYAIRGVLIPEYVMENPKRITTYRIYKERNTEVRRIMIDRYKQGEDLSGAAAYIKDAGANVIDHDERWGTLYRAPQPQDEDIVILEVVNRTPEPDGHFKHYHIRVPPTAETAHEAAAWTFGYDSHESKLYKPIKET